MIVVGEINVIDKITCLSCGVLIPLRNFMIWEVCFCLVHWAGHDRDM